jgi:hypothetical protein
MLKNTPKLKKKKDYKKKFDVLIVINIFILIFFNFKKLKLNVRLWIFKHKFLTNHGIHKFFLIIKPYLKKIKMIKILI